jgi:hypothetical protein
MGQYYKPCCLDKRKRTVKSWLLSHDYDHNGLKLMEHSWIGNSFMNVVENLLTPGGAWYKQPLVWAGDYAEPKKERKNNCYRLAPEDKKLNPPSISFSKEIPAGLRYILNHTKKMYVDKTKVPVTDVYDETEFKIHPLSLLTCEGNGQGGGDFFGADANSIVGSWARHIISIEGEVPKGYKELEFDLKEG